jgi:hypothetical protein
MDDRPPGRGFETPRKPPAVDPQKVATGTVAMMDDILSNDASLPLPVLERIEHVCLRFEAAWKQGDKPRIEEYLDAAQGAERGELLRELLLLDLDYCNRSGQQPTGIPTMKKGRMSDESFTHKVRECLSRGTDDGVSSRGRRAHRE